MYDVLLVEYATGINVTCRRKIMITITNVYFSLKIRNNERYNHKVHFAVFFFLFGIEILKLWLSLNKSLQSNLSKLRTL